MPRMNYGVIDKSVLGEERKSLRFILKQQEAESLTCKLGPPSVMWHPKKVPQHLYGKFWQQMLKEGTVVPHPLGGYMHPRFKDAVIPTKAEAKTECLAQLKQLELLLS